MKASRNRISDSSCEKVCAHCRTIFTAQRASAKYCSQACRQAAYAGRTTADLNRVCLVCGRSIGHRRADAIYCDDQCRSIGGRMVREAMAAIAANVGRAPEDMQPVPHWELFDAYADILGQRL